MSERNYYVICDDRCLFPAMTKEQIIAAIAEATGFTPQHIDDAFITKIKELNKNSPLKFWVGTQAQYNAITPANGIFYILTDADPLDAIRTRLDDVEEQADELNTSVQQIITRLNNLPAHADFITYSGVISGWNYKAYNNGNIELWKQIDILNPSIEQVGELYKIKAPFSTPVGLLLEDNATVTLPLLSLPAGVEEVNGYIDENNNWQIGGTSKSFMISTAFLQNKLGGTLNKLILTGNGRNSGVVAFLTSNEIPPVSGYAVDNFAAGETGRRTTPYGGVGTLDIPNDCKFIVVAKTSPTDHNMTPEKCQLQINGINSVSITAATCPFSSTVDKSENIWFGHFKKESADVFRLVFWGTEELSQTDFLSFSLKINAKYNPNYNFY